MTSIHLTPLMAFNPDEFSDQSHALVTAINRLNRPWEETIPVEDICQHLAKELDLDPGSELISLITNNPVTEITWGDLFIGGSNVTALRTITLENLDEILTHLSLNKSPLTKELFVEFETLKDNTNNFYALGTCLLYPSHYDHRNVTLWDGKELRLIQQTKHNRDIPKSHIEHEGALYQVGGYNYSDRVESDIQFLNAINQVVYPNRVNHDWVVGKDHSLISCTYVFLHELYLEARDYLFRNLGILADGLPIPRGVALASVTTSDDTLSWTYDQRYVSRDDNLSQPWPNYNDDVLLAPCSGTVKWASPQDVVSIYPDANAVRGWDWYACLVVDLPGGRGIMVPGDRLIMGSNRQPLYIVPNTDP